ncbi:DUF2339 domain-containing protein [Alkanindiges sp. WGS2144]|uniref:DUF2339 domain-containing protein n=1 Tax=Alkanindiges sp. WGS2144 TaxID=3366808 RepID=UPI003751178E
MIAIGFWAVMWFLPLILAICALVISRRTQQQLIQKVNHLEQFLTAVAKHSASTSQPVQPPQPASAEQINIPIEPDNHQVVPEGIQANEPVNSQPVTSQPLPTKSPLWQDKKQVRKPAARPGLEPDEHSLNVVTSIWQSLLQWFRGGNAIVRVGVMVLLVGVVLLLRLANDLFIIPIEVRLGVVAFGGVALTLLGLKLRLKRRSYAMSIQGAGLAIIYFTLFAAFRLYEVLPASLTFALLAVLAGVSAGLALMQNALPLAVLAFGGGFLAPLLTSTGSNNLVGLFSYYLLLNLALAWLAHYKTWKVLNVLGAFMTFGVAGYLGFNSYENHMRWPLEILLLAHLALYLFIVVRYSQQLVAAQETQTEPADSLAAVDSTLLFGVPLMGFALQAGLLHDIPYALAFSSAVLSAIYLWLGYKLFYHNKKLVLLTEGVLALGVGFMALVIPLALEAQWTAMGWAVQGTALVWLGKRQSRVWSIRFGILLQVLTLFALAWAYIMVGRYIVLPLAVYTVALYICAVLLRSAQSAQVLAATQPLLLRQWLQPSFILLVWAFAASQFMLVLLEQKAGYQSFYWPFFALQSSFYPLGFALISLAASWHMRWLQLKGLLTVILAGLTLHAGLIWLNYASLAAYKYVLLWVIAGYGLLGYLLIHYLNRHQLGSRVAQFIWLTGLLIHSSSALQLYWPEQPVVAAIILPLVILTWLWYGSPRLDLFNTPRLLQDLSLPASVCLLLWMVVASLDSSGQVFGLPYIPLVNLLDICLLVAGFVAYQLMRLVPIGWMRIEQRGGQAVLGLAAFIGLTGLIIRTLHQWAGTPLWLYGAWHNDLVQTSLTIVWSLCALVLTGLASRYAWREVWLVGIVLLVVVVAKLLLIDLSNAATLARIISFIGAGLMMLLIGYIAPLPPVTSQHRHQNNKDK